MSVFQFQSVSFGYDPVNRPIFRDLNLSIDITWKTGLVGRNGMGKTTLLNLVMGRLEPLKGSIMLPCEVFYFPFQPGNPGEKVFDVIKQNIAPFALWERQMAELLGKEDEESLLAYSGILEKYTESGGYEADAWIEREWKNLGMEPSLLEKPFESQSGGEKNRCLIIPLFLRKNAFPLIDEPTSHLDMQGREILGEYLRSKKSGYLLVSHDRYFLDICSDHIVALEKSGVTVRKGNFSQWKENRDRLEEFEERRDENIKRELKALKTAAAKRREWSWNAERGKMKKAESEGKLDKGYIGAVSARLAKRALSIEGRMEKSMEEKSLLLRNKEKKRTLKMDAGEGGPDILLQMDHVSAGFEGRPVITDFSLVLRKGERIAVIGKNGSGKTTLLNAAAGSIPLAGGSVHRPPRVNIIRVYQNPQWNEGILLERIENGNIDPEKFRNILAAMGMKGDILGKDLSLFSEGERKKIEICRSFAGTAGLLLWDEPLNYIDLYSREQMEEVILEYKPSLLFVEHDRYFTEKIATDRIILK